MATAKPTQLMTYQQQKLSVKNPSVAVSPASSPSAKLPSKLRSPLQAVRESRNTNTAPVRGGGTICGGPGRRASDRGAGFVQNRSLRSRSTNGLSGGAPPEDGDTGKTWERDRVSYGPSRESFRGGRNGGLVNGNAGDRFDPGRPQVRVYGRRSGIGRGFDVKRDGAGRDKWGAATDDFVARDLVKTCLKGGKTLIKKNVLKRSDKGWAKQALLHQPSMAYTTGTTKKRRKIQMAEVSIEQGETRWLKTGKTKPVIVKGEQKGCKKIMVLYTNPGKNRKPEKTNWLMH